MKSLSTIGSVGSFIWLMIGLDHLVTTRSQSMTRSIKLDRQVSCETDGLPEWAHDAHVVPPAGGYAPVGPPSSQASSTFLQCGHSNYALFFFFLVCFALPCPRPNHLFVYPTSLVLISQKSFISLGLIVCI
jgi:hypothetical protein